MSFDSPIRSSWSPPPVDGSLTVPEIFDWHYEHNPDHISFVYPDGDGSPKQITMKEAVRAMHRAGRYYTQKFTDLGYPPDIHNAPVIAIYAATDTVSYLCTWLGIARAGYTVFHISPRNSATALAHLLKNAGAVHVLTSSELALKQVVEVAVATLNAQNQDQDNFVSEMPEPAFLFKDDEAGFQLLPKRTFDPEALVFYIHSSGTTSLPKPVPYTNRIYLGIRHVFEGTHDFRNKILACQSIPMFHGLGVVSIVMLAVTGVTFSIFKPQRPAIPVSPEYVWEAALATRAAYVFMVPSVIEAWARDPVKVAALAKNKISLLYGGSALPSTVGDFLISQHVDVYVTYGASENGMKAPILPSPPGKDWEYFTLLSSIHSEFVDHGNGTFELVVVDGPEHTPRVFNTRWGDKNAFATGDLLVPHPTKTGFWKVFGRVDDQLVLSNGEKTNPGPLEDILCEDPHIQAAVMFGAGRFQNGVLIQPSPNHTIDPQNHEQLANFRRAIWPAVLKMNAFAPQHSRLFREMIIVTSTSKPILYTPKGSLRRSATLNSYQAEIEAVYTTVIEAAQEDIPAPLEWTPEFILAFVRQAVTSVVKMNVSDQDDLFQRGCDSLQATWIRNTIARALRQCATVGAKLVPEDMVYMHPTIAALASFCADFHAPVHSDADEQDKKQKTMLALVSKYTKSVPAFVHGSRAEHPRTVGDVILLSGTTGGLGSSLLRAMVLASSVVKIYALNRSAADGEPLVQRQRRSFLERGLDDSVLSSPKLVLVEGNLTKEGLGVHHELLKEMRASVTGIIHNAWRVDFNLALSSFEDSLCAVRGLVDFALSTVLAKPPRIVFTSSVSVLRNTFENEPAVESEREDPSCAIGTGYAESKWVAEHILARASAATPALETVCVRVGQLSGGASGAWNANEWFPSIVRSGRLVGRLPTMEENVAWVPLDAAAAAILEMTLAPTALGVLHLAHPQPVSWKSIISVAAKELGVPLVPYADWLRALEESLQDASKSQVEHMRANPALRLLPFYKKADAETKRDGREAMGLPLMNTTRAQEVAPSLRELQPLREADVTSWMAFWKRTKVL